MTANLQSWLKSTVCFIIDCYLILMGNTYMVKPIVGGSAVYLKV